MRDELGGCRQVTVYHVPNKRANERVYQTKSEGGAVKSGGCDNLVDMKITKGSEVLASRMTEK